MYFVDESGAKDRGLSSGHALANEANEAEMRRAVTGLVATLPKEKHLRLVKMRYVSGMTFLEIAERWNVCESAVHAMHGRVLGLLRRALHEQGIRSINDFL